MGITNLHKRYALIHITVSTEFRYDAFCQLVLLDYNQDKSNEYGKLILKDSEITALYIFQIRFIQKKNPNKS